MHHHIRVRVCERHFTELSIHLRVSLCVIIVVVAAAMVKLLSVHLPHFVYAVILRLESHQITSQQLWQRIFSSFWICFNAHTVLRAANEFIDKILRLMKWNERLSPVSFNDKSNSLLLPCWSADLHVFRWKQRDGFTSSNSLPIRRKNTDICWYTNDTYDMHIIHKLQSLYFSAYGAGKSLAFRG